ncbi:MAG: WG repeat-containing protein, partial [Clostridia bacterium]|nr:WG repeat-containing protein [Clostridia bacterium]
MNHKTELPKEGCLPEPVLCDAIVYEDENICVQEVWSWDAKAIVSNGNSLSTVIHRDANFQETLVLTSLDGKRISSLDFCHIGPFSEGRYCVGVKGKGYGYLDADGKMVIPPIYETATNFRDGKAIVTTEGNYYSIDLDGNATLFYPIKQEPSELEKRYAEVEEFFDGRCRVSTIKNLHDCLAYFDENEWMSGFWGYVDETGREVIPPQYIFAQDFENGLAIVAKGRWVAADRYGKRDQIAYRSEDERWGVIDVNGNEVLPFIFDDIQTIEDRPGDFIVHHGGWEDGKCGIFSADGTWLVEPIFEEIEYFGEKDLVRFSRGDEMEGETLFGVYDLSLKKILFEPQFFDVLASNNGQLEVEVFDKQLYRQVTKIIDRNGKEAFPSVYTHIFTSEEPYQVTIQDENGIRNGLIDKNGTVILPCKYRIPWQGMYYERRLFVFEQDNKQGLMDFDENIILPPSFLTIDCKDSLFIRIRVGEKTHYKDHSREGLATYDGKIVLPPVHGDICLINDYILCRTSGNNKMYKLIRK